MKTVVIGGGIAGLTTAVALQRAGHEVTVLEQADRFREIGSGLSLWPNALRALQAIGLREQVLRLSRTAQASAIRDSTGRPLSRVDVQQVQRRFGSVAMIHRADLLEVLRAAAGASTLRPGVRVQWARPDGTVGHRRGTIRADLVVAADGINSVVRASIWPRLARPRYLGYTAYRMLAAPTAIQGEGESWGRGERFGYAPLADGRVYCFAVVNAPRGGTGQTLAELRRRFGSWHDPIPALLQAVSADAVLHHDLYELAPLPSYVSGSLALVGDAAHAMAPNLGQGAGQAMEDAVTLAAALSAASLPDALAAYDNERRPRTQAIARRSRRIGAVGQWRSRAAVALRDRMVRALPDGALMRSLAPVVSWQAPTIGVGGDAAEIG